MLIFTLPTIEAFTLIDFGLDDDKIQDRLRESETTGSQRLRRITMKQIASIRSSMKDIKNEFIHLETLKQLEPEWVRHFKYTLSPTCPSLKTSNFAIF